MNILSRLTKWFDEQCNGDWEHHYGIKIETLDNPGFLIKIDIKDTKLISKHFNENHHNVSELLIKQAKGLIPTPFTAEPPENNNDWFNIIKKDNTIIMASSSNNLEVCLNYFLEWSYE